MICLSNSLFVFFFFLIPRWSQLVTRLTFETRNILRFQHHERYYPALFLKEDLKEKILMHKDALISEFLINSDGELRRQVFLEIWSLVEKELMADSRIHVTELTIDGFQKICWKYSSSDLCLGKEPVTTSSSSPSSSSPPSSS